MKIAIVGAGKLGQNVAEALLGTGYEIALIDKDPFLLQNVGDKFDLLTFNGNGKDIDMLKEVSIGSYDFLVATTNDDEKNMVISSFAKKLGCSKVIARIRDPEYVNYLNFIKETMNIDYIVNPDLSIAKEIYKYLVEKYTLTDGYFSTGLISIIEFTSERFPTVIGRKISDIGKVLDNMLVVAISRNGRIIVPNGDTIVEEEDYLYVLGLDDNILKLKERVHEKGRYTDLQKVMIAGGGKSGYYLAKLLADFNISVKIIEIDKDRCHYLSEHLNDVIILNGDATDMNFLEDENIDEMDAFVSVTGFDEENLLLALLANEKEIEDVVAKISRKSYANLIERMGVSMAINPLEMAATEILRFIQGSKHILFSKMIQGQAEFIEIVAKKHMKLTGVPISRINFPEGVILAAIHRYGEAIIPCGDTVILEGDKVIIFFLLSSRQKLEKYI
ncbi:MAG TPA: Trk system potassium transporter TrkA [Anaerovoracaceae bacterium]|nr:Trk system potassium transporter TrkA [Anaerovoracaceae bacterium]